MINDIADYLELLGVGTCAIGTFSDARDDVMMLEWKAGIQPSYSLGRRKSFQRRPFLQVVVRHEDYNLGDDIANKVVEAMESIHGEYDDEIIISAIHNGEILGQGRDTKMRWRFLMNFTLRTIGGN